ncbi:MAG: hypothetical protein QOE37_1314 [Microbacteriaceae bacterium]|nr:hypothetical protein [Microbacteriaceae bacterium]
MRRAGVFLLLPLIAVLAGCAEPAPGTASGAETAGTPTAALDALVSESPAPGDEPVPDGAGPSTAGAGPAAPARCTQDRLRVGVVKGDSGAGSVVREIVFTNESGRTCTLRGAPEVFVVDSSGSQIGRAAVPTGQTATVARIRPSGTARATLTSVNIGTDGGPLGEACAPVDGDGYAVTAPGSTRLTSVKQGVFACTTDQVWMRIGPVTLDAGSEG